jgi:hypothetical protein
LRISLSLQGQLILQDGFWKLLPGPTLHPVEALLQEIEKAIEADLNYLALLLTLTLPDICAALESADARSTKILYKKWYKQNIFAVIGGMSPDEAYELRCTVVHQSTGLASSARTYSRVVFTMRKGQYRIDSMVLQDALTFDLELFCRRWIKATRDWVDSTRTDPIVLANLPNLLQVRPFGLAPYVVGMPIIA